MDRSRLLAARDRAVQALLDEATPAGHWMGELSASALSTATAIVALSLFERANADRPAELQPFINCGLQWLADHQNPDGGWGDTILSHSNISTTILARAAIHVTGTTARFAAIESAAAKRIEQFGGIPAVHQRYGNDRTFSAPILTQCALGGLASWQDVYPLPFELGCLPHSFYKWVQLPVVSYALPALIAIGQARHHHAPSWNPLIRGLRSLAKRPTSRLLESIQPETGGFLEATPLTSFVTMSLISLGEADHPVVQNGIDFLKNSVREDGSWPIDTNLATWVTTLSINALPLDAIPESQRRSITTWLLAQQLKTVHPYTQASPGGWAWTDLSGGVPDADDTPGAILALLKLAKVNGLSDEIRTAVTNGIGWLLDLQNRDGGWPTFCRGWGALPFDRSSNDITAHALRAMKLFQRDCSPSAKIRQRIDVAQQSGMRYLERKQRADGSWLPLWFGNQHAANDENPTYGTAKVLAAYRDLGQLETSPAQRAIAWMQNQQRDSGGWAAGDNGPTSIEETALAVDSLLGNAAVSSEKLRIGLLRLVEDVESGAFMQPAPIGFYFAKLWYFERLYPLIFTVSALNRAVSSANIL